METIDLKSPGEIRDMIAALDATPGTLQAFFTRPKAERRLPFEKLNRTHPLQAANEAVADQHAGRCSNPALALA